MKKGDLINNNELIKNTVYNKLVAKVNSNLSLINNIDSCFAHDAAYSDSKDLKGSGVTTLTNKSVSQNQQLGEELHKPIIRKFKKRKVHSTFKDNIWDADLADMQLIIRYNKGIKFLLSVIDIFSKYAWVVPLKDV